MLHIALVRSRIETVPKFQPPSHFSGTFTQTLRSEWRPHPDRVLTSLVLVSVVHFRVIDTYLNNLTNNVCLQELDVQNLTPPTFSVNLYALAVKSIAHHWDHDPIVG